MLTVTPTVHRYESELLRLEELCRHWRAAEPRARVKRSNRLSVECQCEEPRKLQVTASTFELAPITCGACGHDFAEVAP
jgi:hypothetical protein